MGITRISRSLITSIRTNCDFDTTALTEKTKEMNQRIENNISISENKIAIGLKKAQEIQTQ